MENLRNPEEHEMKSVYVRRRIDKETKIMWACDTSESLLELVFDEMAGFFWSQYRGRLHCVADRHGVVRFYDRKHKRFFPFNQAEDDWS